MKRTTRKDRGRVIAGERGKAILAFRNASFDEAERGYRALEKHLSRVAAATPSEMLEVKRAMARDLLLFAYGSKITWEQLARTLRRIQRLGYSNLRDRVFVANLFVQMVPSFPDKARQAFALLDDAELRLGRLRKRHPWRRDGMKAVAFAREVAARGGVTPPAPRAR